jgi:hypothetical protein
MADNVDDAAAAALFLLARTKPAAFEHLGLLYEQEGEIRRTDTRSSNDRGAVRGRFSVPSGSLRGIFHNHPVGSYEGSRSSVRERFSADDVAQAQALGVPSYISVDDRIRRYDPSSGQASEVLAQFPMEEFRAYLMRKVLGRAPDDPRGLLR